MTTHSPRTTLLRITCRDRIDIPARVYEARLEDRALSRDGIHCIKCDQQVPAEGNEIHDIARVGR